MNLQHEMADQNSLAKADLPLQPHTALNEKASETILFIHGAFGNRDCWSLVTPHLPTYHLLLPDLPSHGESRNLTPFTLDSSAKLLAHLIRTKAHNGKAHIVGFSLGAQVALRLICAYPDLVLTALISGISQTVSTGPTWFTPWLPRGFWLSQRLEACVPNSLKSYLMDGTDLERQDMSVVDMPLCRSIIETLAERTEPRPWSARTLIVAATKSGVIPSLDSPEVAKKLAGTGRLGNEETLAVEHKGMRHPWCRQDPSLFARLVVAWIQGKELPEGFEIL